jgi:hypothetical protein
MRIKDLLNSSVEPVAVRGRAPNGSTPEVTRIRFTAEQREKLGRLAAARGVSLAQVVRDLVEAAR